MGTSEVDGTIQVDDKVRRIIAVHLDVDAGRLSPATRLGEDLCVDSLTAVEILMVLEDEFDIALPEDEVGELRTYADLVNVVADRVAARA
ncbi:MAG TPA: phosphopantetheine-binding protein [Acidimicrobiales bacterium]|nr:phosphopantetheine-binding protein [Acidimicrobiales bacterium]